MKIVSFRIWIPMTQCWWVLKEPAMLSTELWFCGSLEGYRIAHCDPFLRHSRQALARFSRWVRTRAIGRRTGWVHLALYLRHWPDDVFASSLFGHSEKRWAIFPGPWSIGSAVLLVTCYLGALGSGTETVYMRTLCHPCWEAWADLSSEAVVCRRENIDLRARE